MESELPHEFQNQRNLLILDLFLIQPSDVVITLSRFLAYSVSASLGRGRANDEISCVDQFMKVVLAQPTILCPDEQVGSRGHPM